MEMEEFNGSLVELYDQLRSKSLLAIPNTMPCEKRNWRLLAHFTERRDLNERPIQGSSFKQAVLSQGKMQIKCQLA